jgi:hypothetical protein
LVVLEGGFVDNNLDCLSLLMWGFLGALAFDVVSPLESHQYLLDFATAMIPNVECAGHWFGDDVDY